MINKITDFFYKAAGVERGDSLLLVIVLSIAAMIATLVSYSWLFALAETAVPA